MRQFRQAQESPQRPQFQVLELFPVTKDGQNGRVSSLIRRKNGTLSLATFLVSRGKDVKTIQGLLRHAKVTTTLDLYSQSIDAAKLEAQEDIALAITSTAVAGD